MVEHVVLCGWRGDAGKCDKKIVTLCADLVEEAEASERGETNVPELGQIVLYVTKLMRRKLGDVR